MNDFLLGLALVCTGICWHALVIELIPFLGARKFTSKALAAWNTMFHAKPVTWRMRQIVIPSPDLLYSIMKYDLSKSTAIRFTLPDDTYQNLGFYDQNARCIHTRSYVEKGGATIAVSEAAAGDLPDELIRAQLSSNAASPSVVRLPSEKGYVLYRILVTDRSAISESVARQKSLGVDVVPFVPKATGSKAFRLADHLAGLLTSLIVVVFVGTVALKLLRQSARLSEILWLCVYFIVAAAIGIVTALAVAKRLRSNATVGTAQNDVNIGSWSVTYLQDQSSKREFYAYLRFFFHGALGLPSSEAMYAVAISDARKNDLVSDHSYVVEAPTVEFSCKWWSVTAYGHDRFLIENEAEVYSVLSTSLMNQAGDLKIYLSRHKPDNNSPYASMPWIPLASAPVSNPEEKRFRLVFRAYLPDQSAWSPTAVRSLPLPTITRID